MIARQLLPILATLLVGSAILFWPMTPGGVIAEQQAIVALARSIAWQGAVNVEMEGTIVTVRDRKIVAAVAKGLLSVRLDSRYRLHGRLGCSSPVISFSATRESRLYQISLPCKDDILIRLAPSGEDLVIYRMESKIPERELMKAWRGGLVRD